MKRKALLEISVDSVESAAAAQLGGASRVELCSDLAEGGITPSAGLIATARKALSIPLHVMIRPRGGDFCYSVEEFEIMKRDILMAKQLRVDGVVFGILDANGSVDVPRTKELVQLAQPMQATFHRAFDMAADLSRALDDVIRSGAARVLTSGGEPAAENALNRIRELVDASRGRISVMACGGVREHNVCRVVEATGATEIHVGQSGVTVEVLSPMRFWNEKVSIGSGPRSDRSRFIVSEERVRSLVRALS